MQKILKSFYLLFLILSHVSSSNSVLWTTTNWCALSILKLQVSPLVFEPLFLFKLIDPVLKGHPQGALSGNIGHGLEGLPFSYPIHRTLKIGFPIDERLTCQVLNGSELLITRHWDGYLKEPQGCCWWRVSLALWVHLLSMATTLETFVIQPTKDCIRAQYLPLLGFRSRSSLRSSLRRGQRATVTFLFLSDSVSLLMKVIVLRFGNAALSRWRLQGEHMRLYPTLR